MVLLTTGTLSFSQINECVRFTNGNVGINTTTPTSALDVNGTINATNISSGTIYASTGITTGVLAATTMTGGSLSLSGNLSIAGTLTTVNLTSTNLVDTNISSGTINVSGIAALTNVTATNATAAVLVATTGITTGTINATGLSTLTNVSATNATSATLNASTGITTGTINATGLSTLINVTSTNVSSGVLIASTGITTGSINATGLSTLTNVTATNVSAGTINASTGITAGTINATGLSTLTNVSATNATAATLNASTGITTGTLFASNGLRSTFNSNTIGSIITTGGNVGVGTVSPSSLLHLHATSSAGALLTYTGGVGGGAKVDFSYAGSTNLGTAASARILALDNNYAADLFFQNRSTGSDNTTMNTRMMISATGNVGVGTVSPSVTLDVKGQQYVSPSSFTTVASGSQSGLVAHPKLTINTNTNAWPATSGTTASNVALRLRGNDDACLDFGVNSTNAWIQNTNFHSGYNNSYNIVLNPNGGNVGIGTGTSTPGYNLDVSGTGRFTGVLSVGSGGSAIGIKISPQTNGAESSIAFYQNTSEGGAFWVVGQNPNSIGSNNFGIYSSTANRNVISVLSSGNVGIGTNSPSQNLSVVGTNASASIIAAQESETATLLLGTPYQGNRSNGLKAAIIAQGISSWSRSRLHFCLEDTTSGANDAGISHSRMMIESNGYVGIGTTAPTYALSVKECVRFDKNNENRGVINYPGDGHVQAGASQWTFAGNGTLYAQGPYNNVSDSRIKENIVDVDDTSALDILRQIQPKRYNYVDRQNRGDSPVWGFIAQQISSVLDYAVDTTVQYIPNIYEEADVASDNHTITLNEKTTADLAVNMKVRLIKTDKSSVETTITSIVDSKNFTVESDLTDAKHEDKIFVYGIQVDDFHSLNKDAIFTVATAALQEVDRQLQAERQKVANLEQFIQSKFPGEFTP